MKKLLLAALLTLGLAAKAQAAPLYGYVQITTSTALTPALQTGSMNVSSGTIRGFTTASASMTVVAVSSAVVQNQTVVTSTSTNLTSSAFNATTGSITNFTATRSTSTAVTATAFNLSTGSITNVSVSSAVVSNLSVTLSTFTNIVATSIQPGGIVGTNTNDSAAAGNVGEYVTSAFSAVAGPLSTQYGDATSISLTPGDWDVSYLCEFFNTTFSQILAGVGTVTGNNSTGTGGNSNSGGSIATSDFILAMGGYRLSVASTTTYYLKVSGTFGAGTMKVSGRFSARRAR